MKRERSIPGHKNTEQRQKDTKQNLILLPQCSISGPDRALDVAEQKMRLQRQSVIVTLFCVYHVIEFGMDPRGEISMKENCNV